MTSKGVTPVVATVLLIGISIAATFAAWTFILNTQEQTQEGYEDQINQEELEDQTAIDIERVYRSNDNYAFLIIRNIGSRYITLSDGSETYLSMFVNGEPVGATPQDWNYVGTPQDNISAGSTITLNSTETFPTSGVKEFKISARYGASSVHRCAASEGSPC
ncbi:archaellin/type IV pilin N-terminal domain-containing protein [Candidatus Nanohalococcus occultus]|uniref:archaellin/type IV pilin N-terminal domain-containing protein n=1 Tax=Candidatus Nanohalococcus occultus TaxID=2978047 RepID=UPI0039E18EF9